MAKLKITNRFGITPNALLNDKKISLKAKGIYAYIQSKPDDWEFSIPKICSQTSEGREAIASALKELEEFGWLERVKTRDEKGLWDIEYVLHSVPTGYGLSAPGKPYDNSKQDSKKEEIRTTATPTLQYLEEKAKKLNLEKYRDTHFDLEKEIRKLEKEQGSAEDIMATYFRDKAMDNFISIPTRKVFESLKGRFYKTAKLLAEYNYQKVLDKMEELQKKYDHEVRIKGEMNATKWTLETVLKEFQK